MDNGSGKKPTEITVKEYDEVGRSKEVKITAERFFLCHIKGTQQGTINSLTINEVSTMTDVAKEDFVIGPIRKHRLLQAQAQAQAPKIVTPNSVVGLPPNLRRTK